MEKETKKMLVVENNKEYLEAAKAFFAGVPGKTDFIEDYESAMAALPKYTDGRLFIDIFIPESKDKKLGEVGNFLLKYIRTLLEKEKNNAIVETLKTENKPLYLSIKRALSSCGKELTGENLVNLPILTLSYKVMFEGAEAGIYQNQECNRLVTVLKTLDDEEKKGHSPLGIILGEEARFSKIPFVFVTDANYHGGHRGSSLIVEEFFNAKYGFKPKIFDDQFGSKGNQGFWKAAYENLQSRID